MKKWLRGNGKTLSRTRRERAYHNQVKACVETPSYLESVADGAVDAVGGQLVAGLELIANTCSPVAGEEYVDAGVQAECGAAHVDAAYVPCAQRPGDIGFGIHAAYILGHGYRQGRGDSGAAVRLIGAGDGDAGRNGPVLSPGVV